MSEGRARAALLALALLGVGITSYLVYVHYAGLPVACTSSGCRSVQSSRYAELAGVPVALLGLVAYAAIAASAGARSELALVAAAATALAGLVFSLYLVVVQLAVIGAVCEWCLGSDVVLTAVTALALLRLRVPTRSLAADRR